MAGNFRTHDEDGALDGMSLDEYIIGSNKEAVFMLRASSNSMRDAGIVAGDLLVVDRSLQPKASDIVIAVVDGGFAMRYARDLARAAGPDGQESDIKVEAVVTAVIRKY